MSRTRRLSANRVALASVLLFGLTTQASAATECDDPNQRLTYFVPTVDPTQINKLLSRLGDKELRIGNIPVVVPGLCTDHQITARAGSLTLPFGNAPFMVTPRFGSILVDLELTGPFVFGIDGGAYRQVNCSSSCVLDVPYLGEIFNGCDVETFVVRPVLAGLNASASFDDVEVRQIADTCVLRDCTAVHPLETTSANLINFNVDLTGFGSCEIFIDFPDPFPDLGPFDPCDGIDPLIEAVVEPELESAIEGVFVNRQGEGTLIQVFSRQIVKDGCVDIQEVKDCKAAQTSIAGLLRGPSHPAVNAALYLLPLGLVGGLVMSVRRRRGSR